MANLLSICTRVLGEIGSFNVPTYIIGNPDDTAKQLLAFAMKVGEELCRDYDWQEMISEATVTTVVDQAGYALEADYDRVVSDTTWNQDTQRPMVGNSSAMTWNLIKTYEPAVGTETYFRIIKDQVQVRPIPAAVFDFTYEYLSKAYCKNTDGDYLLEWTTDTDVSVLPADLFIAGIRYYFLKANNLPYGDSEAEYDAVIDVRQQKNTPSGSVDMAAGVEVPGERLPTSRWPWPPLRVDAS